MQNESSKLTDEELTENLANLHTLWQAFYCQKEEERIRVHRALAVVSKIMNYQR